MKSVPAVTIEAVHRPLLATIPQGLVIGGSALESLESPVGAVGRSDSDGIAYPHLPSG